MNEKREHCWHNTGDSFSNGFEVSERVRCCWCGAMAFRFTRKIGMDVIEGHGPHFAEPKHATRIDLQHGAAECVYQWSDTSTRSAQ